jgi:hypothetical protein
MSSAIQLLKCALLKIVENIDAGNSELSEEECIHALEYLNQVTNNNEKLSKYQACKMLGISRAKFDNKVAEGIIPKGKHQQGFKEIF